MQQNNSPTPSPLSTTQPFVSPAKPWFKKPLVLVIAGIILVASAVAADRLTNGLLFNGDDKTAVVNPSLTLYYRDGKTPLWSSDHGHDKTNPAPAFVAHVRNELARAYGGAKLQKQEVRVTTTLDLDLQRAALKHLLAQKDQLTTQHVKDVLFIAEDAANGQIVSWVNGWPDAPGALPTDHTSQEIEVGTLMLPFTYASFLENNPAATADTQLDDTMGPLFGYPCTNQSRPTQGGDCLHSLDYKFLGTMSLRQALGSLRLVPAVKLTVGNTDDHVAATKTINNVMALAKKSGGSPSCYTDLTFMEQDKTQCYSASLFGDGLYDEPTGIVQSYATLVNNGINAAQTPVLAITMDGKAAALQPASQRAISERTARTLTDILKDANASHIKNADFAFTTAEQQKTGAATGVELDGNSFGVIQFSSKYVAGFWAQSGEQKLTGFMERPMYSVTANWLDAAH